MYKYSMTSKTLCKSAMVLFGAMKCEVKEWQTWQDKIVVTICAFFQLHSDISDPHEPKLDLKEQKDSKTRSFSPTYVSSRLLNSTKIIAPIYQRI